MRPLSVSLLLASAAIVASSASVRAQWVTFQDQTSTRLNVSSGLGSADPQEKDYAWADFDQDGDTDLVVVRKSPFTTGGHFPNVLMMNEGGVLVDRTTALASASTVPGSQGFLDATNDRDVVAVDVNGDGWIDLVTATTLTTGQPQYIRVPRVYINLGDDVVGNWQGFLYDDPLRINDMQPGASWNGEHRFCSVAAGDVDQDGDQDIYFADYDQGGSRSINVDDRLLINNGLGYFTDQSAARMTAQMLESDFGAKAKMVDMNGDGKLDIIKDSGLFNQRITISYNNPASGGNFNIYQVPYATFAPYHFDIGDLNNDTLPDMIVSDDSQDRYMLNQGPAGGVATFGPTIAFSYSGGGSDDGFGGNNIIADLDNDGWNDAIIADVDVDIAGCNRRCHIFRNLANGPNVTMQEQLSGGAVVGIPTSMLVGTFDVAVFDIDGDGWKDMVFGRCTGTQVWMNVPPSGMNFTYPNGRPEFIAPGTQHVLDVAAAGYGGVVPQGSSGQIFWSVNNAPFQSQPMTNPAPGQFQGTLPAMVCGDKIRYYVTVDGQGPVTFKDPPTAPTGAHTATAAVALNTIYENNFEVAATGWSVVNTTLTGGAWQVATPNGTTVGAQFAAPNQDAEPGSAVKCWVTQNGVIGGGAGAADVDGGPTDLISPPLNFAGTDGFVSYQRWFFCSTAEDNLTVSVSNNGTTWVPVEVVTGPGQNQWTSHQFKVSDFVTPNATVRVRFRTSDNPNNSTTEAGLDVFKAQAFSCTTCQQQIALATNGAGVMQICGGNAAVPGAILDLAVVSMPGSTNGFLVFDVFLTPTPWLGGTLVSPAPIILGAIFADANGTFAAPLPIGGLLPPGFALHTQTVYSDAGLPSSVGQTNVVKVQW